MQSRYTANVLHRWNHLWVTWRPRTRPEHVEPVGQPPRWAGLEILAVHDGSPDDTTGVVEFRARYRQGDRTGVLHEVSRFQRRAGRWMYVDGDVDS